MRFGPYAVICDVAKTTFRCDITPNCIFIIKLPVAQDQGNSRGGGQLTRKCIVNDCEGFRRRMEGGPREDLEGGPREDLKGGLREDLEGGPREDLEGGLREDLEGGPREDLERGPREDLEGGPR